ncbi:hypothetical protein [Serratia quinivorans]|uniref:hypothetical protein n=1 Tax=Serratia quinivorans TaxID=137545 RepID=UPI003F9E6F8F
MDNKLSELSKPVAFIVRSPRGDVAYRTISQTDADYIARKGYASEPLYSQEYVSALLAELEASRKSNAFLKEQLAKLANFNPDWDMLEACRDSWREVAAALKEAESKLATPVQLPEGEIGLAGDFEADRIVMDFAAVKAEIRDAGFTVEGDE